MENRVEYWANRWEKGSSPWHMLNVNKYLAKHFHLITQVKEAPCRIFVPLCGKTVDLRWLDREFFNLFSLLPIMSFLTGCMNKDIML